MNDKVLYAVELVEGHGYDRFNTVFIISSNPKLSRSNLSTVVIAISVVRGLALLQIIAVLFPNSFRRCMGMTMMRPSFQ